MSEHKITITENTEQRIREVAEELKKVGLGAFADCYYVEDGFRYPFFKFAKPFKKEQEGDPNEEYLFLDVGDEYTVHTRLGHEHYDDLKRAVEIIDGLYYGGLAEIALCFPTLTVRCLIENTFIHQKNIEKIDDNLEAIMEVVKGVLPKLSKNAHSHIAFLLTSPHYLQIMAEENRVYKNSNAYLQSVILGEYPEIFIV